MSAGRFRPGPTADGFLDEHATRAAKTYSAAADHWSLPALSFWGRFGTATVARIPLAAGPAVLDVCCGAGAGHPGGG